MLLFLGFKLRLRSSQNSKVTQISSVNEETNDIKVKFIKTIFPNGSTTIPLGLASATCEF